MAELKNILKEEEGDKYQALLELNIRIAEKLDPSIVDLDTILSPTEICVLLIAVLMFKYVMGGMINTFIIQVHMCWKL